MTDREHQLIVARRRFGRFLRRWRESCGWSGATPENWAIACPELFPDYPAGMGRARLGRGQISELETGRSEKPHPITFLQLEALNLALMSEGRGVITDRRLRDQVDAGIPITHEDGRPWRAPDFFACWLGQLEPPAQWIPEVVPLADVDAEETTARLRGAWLATVDDLGLGRSAGLRLLLRESGPLTEEVEEDLVLICDGIAPEPERLLHAAQIMQIWCARKADQLTDRVRDR